MKTSLLFLTGLLLAGTALAEVNYNLAKEQAKRAAGQASAGTGGSTQPPSGSSPQAPPADPVPAATMKIVAAETK